MNASYGELRWKIVLSADSTSPLMYNEWKLNTNSEGQRQRTVSPIEINVGSRSRKRCRNVFYQLPGESDSRLITACTHFTTSGFSNLMLNILQNGRRLSDSADTFFFSNSISMMRINFHKGLLFSCIVSPHP